MKITSPKRSVLSKQTNKPLENYIHAYEWMEIISL